MKRRIAIALTANLLLWPSLALAAEEEGSGAGSWLTLMFFTINFALFVLILVRFAGPLARKYFSDRASTIKSALSRAQGALAEAEDLANKAAKRMAGLEQELKTLAEELEEETAFQVSRIGELARAASERIRNDARLTGNAIAEAGQQRIRERLASAAATLARDLIARNFQRSDQERLVDSFTERLRRERSA